jgi:lysozyme
VHMTDRAGFRRAVSSALTLVLGSLTLAASSVTGAAPAAAASQMHGVDVSNWQGSVDWGAVARSGRPFAFAKATEGATFVDAQFAANRLGMTAAGFVLRGFYHFARPDRNPPAVEAANFLRAVGTLGPGEVAVLDLEVAPSSTVGDWAAEWLAIVANATGRPPVLYSYQAYLYSVPTSRLTQYPLWVASWGANDGGLPPIRPRTDRWSKWTFWQYTSNALVPGVAGRVDDNIFVGTEAELAALGGTSVPAAPPNPVSEILRGVTDLLGGLLAPKG